MTVLNFKNFVKTCLVTGLLSVSVATAHAKNPLDIGMDDILGPGTSTRVEVATDVAKASEVDPTEIKTQSVSFWGGLKKAGSGLYDFGKAAGTAYMNEAKLIGSLGQMAYGGVSYAGGHLTGSDEWKKSGTNHMTSAKARSFSVAKTIPGNAVDLYEAGMATYNGVTEITSSGGKLVDQATKAYGAYVLIAACFA